MKREKKFLIVMSLAAMTLIPLTGFAQVAPPSGTPSAAPAPAAANNPAPATAGLMNPAVSAAAPDDSDLYNPSITLHNSLDSQVPYSGISGLGLGGASLTFDKASRSVSLHGEIPYACYNAAKNITVQTADDAPAGQVAVFVSDPNGDLRNCINRYKAAKLTCSVHAISCVPIETQANNVNSGDLGDKTVNVAYEDMKQGSPDFSNSLGSIVSSVELRNAARKKLADDQQALSDAYLKQETACLHSDDPDAAQMAFDGWSQIQKKMGNDVSQAQMDLFAKKKDDADWTKLLGDVEHGSDLDDVESRLEDWADSHPDAKNEVAAARAKVADRYLQADSPVTQEDIDSARDALGCPKEGSKNVCDKDYMKTLSAAARDQMNFAYRHTEIAEDEMNCDNDSSDAQGYQACQTTINNRYQKWLSENSKTTDTANRTDLQKDITALQQILTNKVRSIQQAQYGLQPLMPSSGFGSNMVQGQGMMLPNGTYAGQQQPQQQVSQFGVQQQVQQQQVPGFIPMPGLQQPSGGLMYSGGSFQNAGR